MRSPGVALLLVASVALSSAIVALAQSAKAPDWPATIAEQETLKLHVLEAGRLDLAEEDLARQTRELGAARAELVQRSRAFHAEVLERIRAKGFPADAELMYHRGERAWIPAPKPPRLDVAPTSTSAALTKMP